MVSFNLIGWFALYSTFKVISGGSTHISADLFLVEPVTYHNIIVESTISDELA